jgi:LacI family transcriptional regulator
MTTMKEIAKMARVSLGTVSNVLNDSARVREPVRKRVLEAVHATGYQPSQLARSLRRDKSNMIGMIIPDITNPFFPSVVRGAEDVAFANGYHLVLCNTDNDHSKELVHLKRLRAYLPAGLIVIPSSFSELMEQAQSYRRAGTDVVCIDRLPRSWLGDSVTANNEEGSYNATRYMLQLGHTILATITGPLHLSNARDRLNGFKRAMSEAKLHLAPGYVQETTFNKHGGYSKTLILLRLNPRPTAIFAADDMIAFGALQAIHESGLRCPQDISLMGFDDLDLAETTDPSLSSVSQSGYQLGATAAGLLVDRFKDDAIPTRHIVLETSLTLRHSVAAPSQAFQRKPASKGRRGKILAPASRHA